MPACLTLGWVLMRRPLRQFAEDLHVDRACDVFRMRREWLEARFVSALERVDPIAHLRWEDAHWLNDIYWVRDRQTRVLLALVGVEFRDKEVGLHGPNVPSRATAVFEFRKGRWHAEGRRLDESNPGDLIFRNPRFEPVLAIPVSRRPSRGY